MPRIPAEAPDRGAAASAGNEREGAGLVTLFLCGDVMTGRGIDQALPHPGDPRIHEAAMTSALDYVALAERAHGPLARPLGFANVWGDALAELASRRPDARIVNLETAVTRSAAYLPKGINYRMSPANVPCIAAAGIDCCVLANNHVLDWGTEGLVETLSTLAAAGIATAGAGRGAAEAAAPAVVPLPEGRRLLVFAFGSETSGIPTGWAATAERPGVNLLADISDATARRIAAGVTAAKRAGDVVVVSIHWSGNWGYEISARERAFAHALIDAGGADILHGHSSHHPKAIEVYRDRLILYGCGDFLDDYEGISGNEAYRDDLVLMYLPALRVPEATLAGLAMIPFRIRNFRLQRASRDDARWLCDVLSREGRRFNTAVHLEGDLSLTLSWR